MAALASGLVDRRPEWRPIAPINPSNFYCRAEPVTRRPERIDSWCVLVAPEGGGGGGVGGGGGGWGGGCGGGCGGSPAAAAACLGRALASLSLAAARDRACVAGGPRRRLPSTACWRGEPAAALAPASCRQWRHSPSAFLPLAVLAAAHVPALAARIASHRVRAARRLGQHLHPTASRTERPRCLRDLLVLTTCRFRSRLAVLRALCALLPRRRRLAM